ncbi:Hypothetical protein FKW44_014803 [Caligus rogercresseyi]|uniref:Uncharacterized protein n=1 Tax=Caligus rogercresseyi TaxID=217165 RepID=A0A7T8JZZ6_CALRO|nr:Hypothetical protein FKW44_014803 [Caligus rogercresseyi]
MDSCRQSKHFFPEPYIGRKVFHFKRKNVSRIVAMVTGHIGLNAYLYKMGKSSTPVADCVRKTMKPHST